ncbi:hypothetical protein [Altericroceibacterium xinjiangense]|uniref:hypothetical protein n=1 Tax=Altericroceibacterium xinjiangense TaxID=762261 RepID=UPI000F7DEEFE|nr:hypothetical protein [Altericroceibacterium xinjiangense]
MVRKELYAALDTFIAGLRARDPAQVPWANDVFYTENNVALIPGDGLWNTITALGPYDLRFADEDTDQVALFTCVEETNAVSPAAFRLGLKDGRVTEAEGIIARNADEGLTFSPQTFEPKPVMEAMVPPEERSTREELLALADGYFETIEQNDGTIHTRFHPDCNRVENGLQTTNNPDFVVPVARLGCEEQFRLGNYLYDDRLRGRRFPLVDLERGIVLAHGFIDHCGKIGDYELTDGTKVSSPIRRPHTYYLTEAFKIRAGAIEQIEADFITVPYHMPSPWDGREG